MKKYAAIIIDDEKNIREALVILLGQYCPEINICGIAASASEGRKLLENEKVDFIYQCPGKMGLHFSDQFPATITG